jgi:hypothetical protein
LIMANWTKTCFEVHFKRIWVMLRKLCRINVLVGEVDSEATDMGWLMGLLPNLSHVPRRDLNFNSSAS